jgi:hypothetical protein
LVNISNNDIVDGNAKLTLGLIWRIISHWQVSDIKWYEKLDGVVVCDVGYTTIDYEGELKNH